MYDGISTDSKQIQHSFSLLCSPSSAKISTTLVNDDKCLKPRYMKNEIIFSKLIPPKNHHLKGYCQKELDWILLHIEEVGEMCVREILDVFTKRFFLFFSLTFLTRHIFVFLSRTVPIVTLIVFAAIVTLFFHMQSFCLYVLRIRIQINSYRIMENNSLGKKSPSN